MTYLVSQLVEDIRDELHGEFHQEWNIVNGAHNASVTSLAFSDLNLGIGVGSILHILSTGELMYVRDCTGAVSPATVIRGFRGTTAQAIADGAQIEVNPRFPGPRIKRAIQDEIRSWPAGLHAQMLEDFTIGDGQRHVTLSRGDAYRVLEVRRFAGDTHSGRDTYPLVPGPWEITRAAPGPSAGYGVQFGEEIAAGKIHVLYAIPFDVPAVLDDGLDLQDDIGLADGMNEVVRWGAMWRLASREELDRIDLSEQAQPRDAQEVAPGQIVSFARYCKQMRDERIAEEADRLRSYYPIRRA